ncbi:MAG: (d)CMP kinase [Halanaerobiaceae bacterium]
MGHTIAIDGPAGSGKSTAARRLAKRLNYKYLDTGAMYRAVAYEVHSKELNLNNEKEISRKAKNMNLKFTPSKGEEISRLYVDGCDITDKLRIPEVNDIVSRVARIKGVRKVMVKKQREMAANGGLIMDGRDIGSKVLPDADFKFYVTATLEERARRRYKELKKDNPELSFEKIKKSVARRDKIDTERCYSPLIKPDDAYEIDTTDLSIEEVVDKLENIIIEGE